MPLSEDEERILLEIEESLYESDPELAREVSETTVYTKSLKNLKWSVLVFFHGVACMLIKLSISFVRGVYRGTYVAGAFGRDDRPIHLLDH